MVKKVLKGKVSISGDNITVGKKSLSDLITSIGAIYCSRKVKLEVIITEMRP